MSSSELATRTIFLIDLPECIFLLLQSLLTHNEFRNIFNCQKNEYLLRLKKNLCLFYLGPDSTQQYLLDSAFRKRVRSLIANPEIQLGLKATIPLTAALYPLLRNVGSVTLLGQSNSLHDLTVFASTRKLCMFGCPQVKNCVGLETIVELVLWNFRNLTDLSHLANCRVEKLNISKCPRVESLPRLPFLKNLEIKECDSFKTLGGLPVLTKFVAQSRNIELNYSDSPELKELWLKNLRSVSFPGLISFRSIQVLVLASVLHLNPEDMPCLLQLSYLKELEITCHSDFQYFDIHLLQQLKKFSLTWASNFEGITRPMPNLHTVRFGQCSGIRSVSGLAGNKHLKLSIEVCSSFIPDIDFFKILINDIDVLDYHGSYPPNMYTIEKSLENDPSFLRRKRDKHIKIFEFPPFEGPLLRILFENTHILEFGGLKRVRDLSSFVPIGIHKIPILYIGSPTNLYSVYPPRVVPEHERIILNVCEKLWDVSSIANVPRVSIAHCPNVLDITPLARCSRIDFKIAFTKPCGYDELQAKIHSFFGPVPEIPEMKNIFRIDSSSWP